MLLEVWARLAVSDEFWEKLNIDWAIVLGGEAGA